MPKLHQILAIESGEKSKAHRQITELHKAVQKHQLFDGHAKTYHPIDEEGETLPKDNRQVQIQTSQVLKLYKKLMTEIWDITATKEWGNYNAPGASIVVDGNTLAEDVPIPFLLYLAKQLDDVDTAVRALPTLDPSMTWKFDPQQSYYRSDSEKTNRTKKIRMNHVRSEATKEHPAQVEVYTEDVVVGKWDAVRLSGAMPVPEKDELLERIGKLKNAVLFAREEANGFEVEKKRVADSIFGYLFP